jgi:lysozyme
MDISAKGLALLKEFEGCRLQAYQDQGGIWTIGFGYTGPDVKEGTVWDQRTADAQLEVKANVAGYAVNKHVTVPINQNQFDALTCFAYNAFEESTLLRKINDRDPSAYLEFARWDKVSGISNPGLAHRRYKEMELYNSEG